MPAPLDTGEDYVSLFVSDLPLQATETDVARVFQFPMEHLPADAQGRLWIPPFNVTDVRVMPGDAGGSKYAFVRFDSVEERTRALFAMQGLLCYGKPSTPFRIRLPSYAGGTNVNDSLLQSVSPVRTPRNALAQTKVPLHSRSTAARMSANVLMSQLTL